MFVRNSALLLALSLFAGCATVETPAPALTSSVTEPAAVIQPAASLAPDTADEDQVICKMVKAGTVSRLGEKETCLTRKRWREWEEDSKRELDRFQRPR